MAVCDDAAHFEGRIAGIVREARALDRRLPEPVKLVVDDSQKGPAYAVSTPEQRRLIASVARTRASFSTRSTRARHSRGSWSSRARADPWRANEPCSCTRAAFQACSPKASRSQTRSVWTDEPLRWGVAPDPTRGCPPLDPDQAVPGPVVDELRDAQFCHGPTRPATGLPAKTAALTCPVATLSRSTARLRAVDKGPGTAWSGVEGADSPLVGFGATPQSRPLTGGCGRSCPRPSSRSRSRRASRRAAADRST